VQEASEDRDDYNSFASKNFAHGIPSDEINSAPPPGKQ
jgi:hypothetical protein